MEHTLLLLTTWFLAIHLISQAKTGILALALKPRTFVSSDGLWCFCAAAAAGCIHPPKVLGPLQPRELPPFKWVNTVLGNLKTMMSGAFKALNCRKYAQQHLSAFAYRFNHRFNLRDLITSLLVDVAKASPRTEKSIGSRDAEAGFQSGDEMNMVVPWTGLLALIQPPALCCGNHAAHSLHAAVVGPERSGHARGHAR